MSEPFSLMLDTTIHFGKLPDAEAIVRHLVQDVEAHEPGTLNYTAYTDSKTNRCCVLNTYASSEALLDHLSRPAVVESINQLMALSDTNLFTTFGRPTASAREALEGMGATFVDKIAGFERPHMMTAS